MTKTAINAEVASPTMGSSATRWKWGRLTTSCSKARLRSVKWKAKRKA